MKELRLIVCSSALCLSHALCSAQGFSNLDFESGASLPSWSINTYGVLFNAIPLSGSGVGTYNGQAGIPFYIPITARPISGAYSAFLYTDYGGEYGVGYAALWQTATIPALAQSLSFSVTNRLSTNPAISDAGVSVSIDGVVLATVNGSGRGNINVVPYAGQTVELRFTVVPLSTSPTYLGLVGLDNISIFPLPEPTTFALFSLGSLALLTLRRRPQAVSPHPQPASRFRLAGIAWS
jgi:hypothetical protein